MLEDQTDVVWARVEDGFYAASTPKAFLGSVDSFTGGRFIALSAYSRPLGVYPTLETAMGAVIAASNDARIT